MSPLPRLRSASLLAIGSTLAVGLGACGSSGDAGTSAVATSVATTAAATPASTAAPASSTSVPATTGSTASASTAPRDLAELIGKPEGPGLSADDVIVAGSADLPAGQRLRLPVGVLTRDGAPVLDADGGAVDLWAVPSGGVPLGPFHAPYTPIGTGADLAAATADESDSIYVAHDVLVPKPGDYVIVAVYTVHGARRTAGGTLRFTDAETTPAVGSAAPTIATPTLADAGGDAAKLTTRTPPDTSLLRDSAADLIAAHRPFVLVFATPKFCTSRICGPVVDVALAVQKALAGTPMRFVHVEIYKGNDPEQGPTPAVQAWHLPTEPWVFVVGADGRIRSKFEGAVGVDELTRAARAALSP